MCAKYDIYVSNQGSYKTNIAINGPSGTSQTTVIRCKRIDLNGATQLSDNTVAIIY